MPVINSMWQDLASTVDAYWHLCPIFIKHKGIVQLRWNCDGCLHMWISTAFIQYSKALFKKVLCLTIATVKYGYLST